MVNYDQEILLFQIQPLSFPVEYFISSLYIYIIILIASLMKNILINNIDNPLHDPLHVGYCVSFLCRLKGLMFISTFGSDCGLLLVQQKESRVDSSIHMFFVFFDLAVIWLNSDLQVVDKVIARPWRPAYFPCKPARYILEIKPERLTEFNKGDRIDFVYE